MAPQMFTRRRNRRPDTPDEIAADQLAQGLPPSGADAQFPTNLFDQQQQYPGQNFGSQDVNRFGTFDANWLFNQLANSTGMTAGLAPQVTGIYGDILGGRMPQAVQQLMAPVISQGIGNINAQMPTLARQAWDQLPPALAREAIMSQGDSRISGIANLMSGVYNNAYGSLLPAALQAGDPTRLAEQITNQGTAPWNIIGQLGSLGNQRFGIEQAGKAQKGK